MGYFRENIEKVEGYVPGFQPRAVDVIKLNTNENPYPPSPKALKVLSEMTSEQLRRYPDPVGDSFRCAAAKMNGLAPENIMCCNGGDELLNVALRCFCDENRPVAYPVPTYSLYPVLANLQNCPVIEIPFDDEFNLPSKLASTGAPLTIVCNPNAPSGTIIAVEELAELADELTGVLLIDEAYVDFAGRSCVSLIRSFNNVIILRSLSKGYSLAGLRFGYAMAQADLIYGMMKVKDSYNVDAVAIAVATAALRDHEHFQKNVEQVLTERAKLTGQLRALGLTVRDSQTNFVLTTFTDPPAAFIHEQLAARNIFVRYFRLPGLEDKLRISVGTRQQNEKLLAALKEILSQKD